MALLLMAGTSASAQENKSVAPPRERPTTEQLARKATDRMTAQLKLTEKQAEQAYEATLERLQADEAAARAGACGQNEGGRGDEIDPFHRAVHALVADAESSGTRSRSAGREESARERAGVPTRMRRGAEGSPRKEIVARRGPKDRAGAFGREKTCGCKIESCSRRSFMRAAAVREVIPDRISTVCCATSGAGGGWPFP